MARTPDKPDANPPEHAVGPADAGPPTDPVVIGLLNAYAQGVFPMADPESGPETETGPGPGSGGSIGWYDPDPRGILPLRDGGLRVSRSLRGRVRADRFRVTTDTAFGAVIRACAAPRSDPDNGCWIDDRIIDAYERLHEAGHAHSIEAWLDPGREPGCPDRPARLVGGLYGVHLGGLFAGESMFSRPDLGGTDASKVCLVWLWHHLRARGFTLLDTQFTTDHVRTLGGIEISRTDYHARLARAVGVRTEWGELTRPLI